MGQTVDQDDSNDPRGAAPGQCGAPSLSDHSLQPGKKRKCEDCGINDAESKISVKGRLMGLCKPCCIQALADKDEAEADDRVLVCELCKFKFRSQELLDRHQNDWHKCAVCKKICRTEAVAGGDGFVRKCFECSIGAADDAPANANGSTGSNNKNNSNTNDDDDSSKQKGSDDESGDE